MISYTVIILPEPVFPYSVVYIWGAAKADLDPGAGWTNGVSTGQ